LLTIDTDHEAALQGIELQIKSFTHHYFSTKPEAKILADLTV